MRLRNGLAPTPSADPELIVLAASQRFYALTETDDLDYFKLLDLLKNKLPKALPLRSLIAEAGVLTLLEAIVCIQPSPFESGELRRNCGSTPHSRSALKT